MLTIDFDLLDVRPGSRILDLGSGPGRHAFEALRRGARVVALDLREADLRQANAMFAAMSAEREVPGGGRAAAVRADALSLPFGDGELDRVIAAEVLEHIPDDRRALAELARVLRPGGLLAVTVPRWFPERVCWALSEDYHTVPAGHVRIYRAGELGAKMRRAGLRPVERHHSHALHTPYWWLKCASGDSFVARLYHRFLVWDIVSKPVVTRVLERALNPLLGKSLVVYAEKAA